MKTVYTLYETDEILCICDTEKDVRIMIEVYVKEGRERKNLSYDCWSVIDKEWTDMEKLKLKG